MAELKKAGGLCLKFGTTVGCVGESSIKGRRTQTMQVVISTGQEREVETKHDCR